MKKRTFLSLFVVAVCSTMCISCETPDIETKEQKFEKTIKTNGDEGHLDIKPTRPKPPKK